MVMRPDPRMGALTRVKRRDFGPWWLWVIVVVLAGAGAYYAYKSRFLDQRLGETDVVTAALTTDNTGLRASITALERDLVNANARSEKEHAAAEAVSVLLAKLQKRLSELQAELTATQENAAASKKDAEQLRAKAASAEAATAQVQKLQERISALKGDAEAAHRRGNCSSDGQVDAGARARRPQKGLGRYPPKARGGNRRGSKRADAAATLRLFLGGARVSYYRCATGHPLPGAARCGTRRLQALVPAGAPPWT
jgi:hypothetical protein